MATDEESNGTSSAPPLAAGAGTSTAAPQTAQSREQSQLAKLRDANTKYKNLLKLAKERIQETEGVLDERRSEVKQLTAQLNEANAQNEALVRGVAGAAAASSSSGGAGAAPLNLYNDTTILRVCQRVKEEIIIDDPTTDIIPTNSVMSWRLATTAAMRRRTKFGH